MPGITVPMAMCVNSVPRGHTRLCRGISLVSSVRLASINQAIARCSALSVIKATTPSLWEPANASTAKFATVLQFKLIIAPSTRHLRSNVHVARDTLETALFAQGVSQGALKRELEMSLAHYVMLAVLCHLQILLSVKRVLWVNIQKLLEMHSVETVLAVPKMPPYRNACTIPAVALAMKDLQGMA